MANVQTIELNPGLIEVDATLSPEQFIESEYESGLDQKRGVLNRLMESRFSRPLLYASTLATALAFAGPGVSRSSERTGEKTAITASGDLNGPIVQFFEAGNGGPSTTSIENISGIQAYASKRGNGTRIRAATTGGKYDVPVLRINGPTGTWQEFLQSVANEIVKQGYDTKENMNVVYIPESIPQPKGCGFTDINLPENVALISLKKVCDTGRHEGFSLSDVEAAQMILFKKKTTQFIGDKLDTMYPSSPGWLWMNTYINHSKSYTDALGSNKLFQSRVLAPKPVGGSLSFSPAPDRCEMDCGEGYLFPTQTKVQLTAKPEGGMKFKEWTGACAEDMDNVCEVTTSNLQPTEASAVFEQVQSPQPQPKIVYKVTAESKGPGRVKIGAKVAKELVSLTNKKNRVLVITPVPNKNAFFSREYGCDNKKLKKAAAVTINKCYELQDNKNERVVLIFKKEKEIVK